MSSIIESNLNNKPHSFIHSFIHSFKKKKKISPWPFLPNSVSLKRRICFCSLCALICVLSGSIEPDYISIRAVPALIGGTLLLASLDAAVVCSKANNVYSTSGKTKFRICPLFNHLSGFINHTNGGEN